MGRVAWLSLGLVVALLVALTGRAIPSGAAATTLLTNGSFENVGSNWLAPWNWVVRSGAAATIAQDGAAKAQGAYAARVSVTQAAASPWLVQLQQGNLALAAGQAYTVSFAARASAPRALEAVVQQAAAPYATLAGRTVALTTAWQTFTLTVQPAAQTSAFLGFNLAAATGQVWLDAVAVNIGGTAPAPSPPPLEKGVSWYQTEPYWGSNINGINSDLDDMNAAGITWARVDMYYSTSPSSAFDAIVRAAQAHNIRLLVVVQNAPPYHDLGTDAQRATYKTWLGQMVDRYSYHVKHWQIANEPNLHYEWNIDETEGSDPAQYAASVRRYVLHLQDGFTTIRAHDPSAKVLFAGVSEWTAERFLDQLLLENAHPYFDIMAFHPYGADPNAVLNRFLSMKSRLAARAEYAAKPIWITETGFNTSWTNKAGYVPTEQQKADYLTRSIPLLRSNGAQPQIFWYTLHENSPSSGFGLTQKNPTTLQTTYYPAFHSYKNLVLTANPGQVQAAGDLPRHDRHPAVPAPLAWRNIGTRRRIGPG